MIEMKKTWLFLLLAGGLTSGLTAQQLLTPSNGFSHKKTSYITLNDGTEINGTIKDIDRKKGLIELIKIEDGAGKKYKLKPEDVNYMYLPPNGLDNFVKSTSFLTNAKKWNNEKLNQDFLDQGYVYFEQADVKLKKKNMKLLMQLLNPDFSRVIKVYHDPFASETASLAVGGITVAGGDAKSYYVAKGDGTAFRLFKKNYAKEFKPLYGSCDAVISAYPEPKWTDLPEHIVKYTECGQ